MIEGVSCSTPLTFDGEGPLARAFAFPSTGLLRPASSHTARASHKDTGPPSSSHIASAYSCVRLSAAAPDRVAPVTRAPGGGKHEDRSADDHPDRLDRESDTDGVGDSDSRRDQDCSARSGLSGNCSRADRQGRGS